MHTSHRLLLFVPTILLVLAGCGSTGNASSAASAASQVGAGACLAGRGDSTDDLGGSHHCASDHFGVRRCGRSDDRRRED